MVDGQVRAVIFKRDRANDRDLLDLVGEMAMLARRKPTDALRRFILDNMPSEIAKLKESIAQSARAG